MSLDRVHTSDVPDISSHRAGSRLISPSATPRPPGPALITTAVSTPLLRRCTALAAQARVELLTESRRAAIEELDVVLAEIETWSDEELLAPDPTMMALAAAALQDLDQRLSQASMSTLEVRITAALEVLHTLLAAPRLRAMA